MNQHNSHDSPTPATRAGIVAVVGRANAGKSTLVNALVEEKVSIVSPVAQTTRNRIRGIWTEARGQLVFLDTPGMHKAMHDLGRLMNRMARTSAEGADVILLVLDATALPRLEDEGWMQRLSGADTPLVLALNKIDALTPRADQREAHRALWSRIHAETQGTANPRWMEISAKTGEGVETLRTRLFELVPEGPLLFPEDMLSDFPRKLMMADFIREKLFQVLQDELPYAVAVRVESITESDEVWSVHGVIYVNKPSQKAIVIGKKGRLLQQIREAAEKELAEIYERRVSLHLWVRVHKHWARDPALLQQLGYTL